MLKFEWWRDLNNRDGAKAILDVLKVLVTAALVVVLAVAGWIGLTQTKPEPAPTIQTGDHSPVNAGPGQQIVASGGATVIVGLTFEQHKAELQERLAEREAQLGKAHGAERDRLRNEIATLSAKLQDAEADYATTVEELRLLRLELERIAKDVPAEKLATAQEALYRGDRTLADTLVAEVEAAAQDTIQTAARAAFLRGEIAEQEIRWADAAAHYARAARLDPSFEALRKASEFSQRAGLYRQAARYSEDLVALARASEAPERLAAALNEHALNSKQLGNFPKAETLYREALDIGRATIGDRHPDYATHLNNLAGVVQAQGRYAEAEALYREALEIDRATIGDRHPDYATRLNNLAGVVRAQGRYAEAEALYREALEIGRATIGDRHPDHATRLNNLAGVLAAQGKPAEARPLYEQALGIFTATLPADHPYIATIRNHLANLPDPDPGD